MRSHVLCVECNKEVKTFKKETAGIVFLSVIIPYLVIFGVSAITIIYSVMFLGVGLTWLIKKPSRNFVCQECSSAKLKE
jgi:hypothetical protein